VSTATFWAASRITSNFGDPRDGGKRKHRGTDYSHGRGVAIPSPLTGVVTGKLAPASWHGFGYQVTIRSDAGPVYSFAHMNGASPLAVGARVAFGQTIGYEGSTGATTGPCVHVEYNNGGFSDPAPHIAALIASAGGSGGGSVKLMRIVVPGVSVLDVQKRLVAHKIDIGPTGADGRNGPATSAGLEAFQRAKGLVPDRVVGPATWAKLSAAPAPSFPPFPLPAGSYFGPEGGPATSVSGYHGHGKDLAVWQQRMKYRGWNIVADGLYGPKGAKTPIGNTAAIAKAFQHEKGLTEDSLIGKQTWDAAWTAPIT
jgi:peptidoglycan hydrolase-like protein with peptidoglycan-binding domain